MTDRLVLATMLNVAKEGGQVPPTEEVDEHFKGVLAIAEGLGHLTGGTRIDNERSQGLVSSMVSLTLGGPEEELPTFAHGVP
jgi:hypothetical protein